MTCAEFQAVVTDLGRKRLDDPDTCGRASRHASRCASCARLLDDEEAVTLALHDLRAATSDAAPDWIERKLRHTLARQRPSRTPSRRWGWATAAAAAAAAFGVIGIAWLDRAENRAATTPVVASIRTTPHVAAAPPARRAEPRPEHAPQVSTVSAPRATAPRERRAPAASRVAANANRRRETVTDFVWLPYGAPTAFETAQVVRVRVPRSVLSSIGLPMDGRDPADRVHADVVVGEDGLARAIRLVQTRAPDAPFE